MLRKNSIFWIGVSHWALHDVFDCWHCAVNCFLSQVLKKQAGKLAVKAQPWIFCNGIVSCHVALKPVVETCFIFWTWFYLIRWRLLEDGRDSASIRTRLLAGSPTRPSHDVTRAISNHAANLYYPFEIGKLISWLAVALWFCLCQVCFVKKTIYKPRQMGKATETPLHVRSNLMSFIFVKTRHFFNFFASCLQAAGSTTEHASVLPSRCGIANRWISKWPSSSQFSEPGSA